MQVYTRPLVQDPDVMHFFKGVQSQQGVRIDCRCEDKCRCIRFAVMNPQVVTILILSSFLTDDLLNHFPRVIYYFMSKMC